MKMMKKQKNIDSSDYPPIGRKKYTIYRSHVTGFAFLTFSLAVRLPNFRNSPNGCH